MADKKIPTNLSQAVLDRLEKVTSGGNNTPFATGLVDFNYTLGIPLITGGFSFIYFDRVPKWFEKHDVMKHFKRFFQANFRSFDGHQDLTSQPVQYIAGAVGYNIPLPGDVAAPNSEFNTTYMEYTGSPGKAMLEIFFNALHDFRTGHSILGDIGWDFGDPMNWTVDVLYFEVRKDFKNNNKDINTVEFASYWRGVFPTTIPTISDHNYQLGQASGNVTEGRVTWAGVQDLSPRYRDYAFKILHEEILNPESETNSYIRYLDSLGADEKARGTLQEDDDVLYQIYKLDK